MSQNYPEFVLFVGIIALQMVFINDVTQAKQVHHGKHRDA
jgi:hypothetical protein